jgi:hypothetical protein
MNSTKLNGLIVFDLAFIQFCIVIRIDKLMIYLEIFELIGISSCHTYGISWSMTSTPLNHLEDHTKRLFYYYIK